MSLPPLPEPASINGSPGYTADQMRAYAEAAVLAERERCVQVCKALDDEYARSELPGFVLEVAVERITKGENLR